MARVTVEDCLEEVENRFALVHAAAKRTKQIFKGSNPLVDCKNREVVTALREIAAGKIGIQETESEETTPKKKKKGK
ncbi:MAG: DNA-directed RNA polymerase subunit omega [Deltaproteobacteria bacterium]|nr:DNA-directed RNA polymerase subunit omega [Deltaproteobacteria bacterium]